MTGARRVLPARRPSVTVQVVWRMEGAEQVFDVTAGIDPGRGRVAEVFACDRKTGSHLSHTIADACVVISVALQHGAGLAALARSLGTVPVMGRAQPASPLGAILGALIEVEAELIEVEAALAAGGG